MGNKPSAPIISLPESFYKGTIELKSCHGRFISCDSNEDVAPRADETEFRSEEVWRLYAWPDGSISFAGQVRGGVFRYLCAEGNGVDVRCNRTEASIWEKFYGEVVRVEGDRYFMYLKTHHGTYLSAAPPDHRKPHVIQSRNRDAWEVFELHHRDKEDHKFWDKIADALNGKQISGSIPFPSG